MKHLAQLILLLALSLPLLSSGQRIDSTFGVNGFLQPDLYSQEDSVPVWGLVKPLPDGKFMAAGVYFEKLDLRQVTSSGSLREDAFDLWIRRLHPDGKPDSSFGTNGIKILPLGFKSHALYDFRIMPSGGMMVLFRENRISLKVLVLDPEGNLDPEFGEGGVFLFERGGDIFSGQVVLLPNEELIVVGTSDRSFFAVKFKKDGSRAMPFGSQGYFFFRTENISNGGNRIKFLELDGNYHVLGGGGEYPSVLFRLHVDGFLDRFFADEGIYKDDRAKFHDGKRRDDENIVLLQPDGLTLLSQPGVFISKTLFSDNSAWPFSVTMNHLGASPSGKWLLSGWSQGRMMVARLDSVFLPDTSYGDHGFRRAFFTGNPNNSFAYLNSCFTSDGGIIYSTYHGIVKFDSTSMVESTFGTNGYLFLHMPYSRAFWNVIQSDEAGDIWLAGGNGKGNLALGHVGQDGGDPVSTGLQGTKWLNTPRLKDPKRGNIITDMTWGGDQHVILSGRLEKKGFVQKYNAEGEADPLFDKVVKDQIVDQTIMMSDQKIIFRYRDLPLQGQPNFTPRTHIGKVSYNGNPEPRFSFDKGLAGTPLKDFEYQALGMSVTSDKHFIVGGSNNKYIYFRKATAEGWGDPAYGAYMIEEETDVEKEGNLGLIVHYPRMMQAGEASFYHRFEDGKMLIGSRKALGRFFPTGELDSTFGDKAWLPLPKLIDELSFNIIHRELIFLQDSSILSWGSLRKKGEEQSHIFLVKYDSKGQADKSFGKDGLFILERECYSDIALELSPQTDSTFIIAGISNARMMVTRIIANKTKAPTIPMDSIPVDTLPPDTNLLGLSIFPNPIQNHQVNVQFQITQDQHVSIALYSIKGQWMTSLLSAKKAEGIHLESLEIPQNIYPGNYLLRIRMQKADSWHKIVILP
jgi:uncharacterized delta-60 repeat protein